MKAAYWIWPFLLFGLCAYVWSADKDDEAKTPADIVADSEERETISGTFRLNRDALNDGKPLPKVIGILTEDGGLTYFLIVEDKGFLEVLTASDGKNLTLCGKTARIEEQGIFMMVDSKITRPTPPTTRRKRGGL